MSLFTGIIITPFLIYFPKEFLVLMSAEPKIVDISKGFLQIVGSFLVFRLVILTCNGILRGAGNTKTPMKVTLVINCVNILFNWLLIFGIGPFPKLGILGSAWSTAIAYTVGSGLLGTKLFSGKYALHIHIRQILQIHAKSLRRIVRISIPATIDTVATQMGFLFFTKIVLFLVLYRWRRTRLLFG